MTFFLCLLALARLASGPIPTAPQSIVVENRGLRVEIDPAGALISRVQNRQTNETYELLETGSFELVVDGRSFGPAQFHLTLANREEGPQFTFQPRPSPDSRPGIPDLQVVVAFRSRPERHFIEKVLWVTNKGDKPLLLERVSIAQYRYSATQLFLHPHYDPSLPRWLINAFLRGGQGGVFLGVENPFVDLRNRFAQGPPIGTVELSYRPRWLLAPGETFESEPAFLGTFRKEGVFVFKELGRLFETLKKFPNYPPTYMRLEQEILDWGEVWAMQNFLQAIQPPQDYKRPGYYLRAIGPVKDVAGSKAFADTVAGTGRIPHIEWNTFIPGKDPGSPAVWVNSESGPLRLQPNPAWIEIVGYARQKGILSGTMEAVPNAHYSKRSDWLVLDRDGKPATGWPGGVRTCLANKDYIRWYADEYDRLVRQYDLYMLAWDSPAWMWLSWPEPAYECYAANHPHPPGDVRYYVWRSLGGLFAELHRRHPRLAMRIAAGLQPGYPWVLGNLIEHHNGFFDNEPGASYWRSLNYRFIPVYKATTTMAAANWAELKYNFFRSLSLADKAMIWQNGLPLEEDQRQFFRKWMEWADQNLAYLRVRRDLFREPWGDDFINRAHVDMEGHFPWPDPQIHGSAHCLRDGGYIFLFNPSKKARIASLPVNHWIGLTEGTLFAVRELFPDEKRTWGTYRRGEELKVVVAPESARLLQISPSAGPSPTAPVSVPTGAPVDKAFYAWDEIPWKEITIQP